MERGLSVLRELAESPLAGVEPEPARAHSLRRSGSRRHCHAAGALL